MPNKVSLVTIHHEGAGSPTNTPRGAEGGYTYWIGTSIITWLRSVWDSYATKGFNHVSLDICLSGNREVYQVLDEDIALIKLAVSDARRRGYVVDNPMVRDHHNSPGSNTVCPGKFTMSKWTQIVAACQAKPPTPIPIPKKETGAMRVVYTPSGKGYYIVAADGGVFCYGDAHFAGSMGGRFLSAPVVDMAVKPSNDGYILASADGGVFAFGSAVYLGGMATKPLNAPIVGCAYNHDGTGYILLGKDGGVFAFHTEFLGSAAGQVLYTP